MTRLFVVPGMTRQGRCASLGITRQRLNGALPSRHSRASGNPVVKVRTRIVVCELHPIRLQMQFVIWNFFHGFLIRQIESGPEVFHIFCRGLFLFFKPVPSTVCGVFHGQPFIPYGCYRNSLCGTDGHTQSGSVHFSDTGPQRIGPWFNGDTARIRSAYSA